jgi:hypothetical protein
VEFLATQKTSNLHFCWTQKVAQLHTIESFRGMTNTFGVDDSNANKMRKPERYSCRAQQVNNPVIATVLPSNGCSIDHKQIMSFPEI